MSLVRRTSVAAVAVTGLVLALVMTLVASGASGTAAERTHGAHAPQPNAHWEPGHSKAGLAKIQRQTARRAAHSGARFRTYTDRVLGAQPVLSYRGVADPTVARYAGGWVGVSTGPARPASGRARSRAARGRTSRPRSPCCPTWAISGRDWASDLVQVNGLWLLYFSAEVAGLGLDGRCIGVATATDPTQTLRPRRAAAGLPEAGGRRRRRTTRSSGAVGTCPRAA